MAWRKPANLNEWLGILVRHKKKFFFPTIVTMIAVIWASQWMPREYRAEAKFKRFSEASVDVSRDTMIPAEYEKLRSLMQHNFRGRPAIEQLIKDQNLTKGFPRTADGELTADGRLQYEQLIREMSSRITVNTEVDNEQIELVGVSFTHEDRALAPKVANTLVDNYIRNVRTQLNEALMKQKKFFDGEVNRYKRKVSELEGAKLRFAIDNGGLTPDDPATAHNKLNELKKERDEDRKELEKNKKTLAELMAWEKEQPEFIVNRTPKEDPELTALKEKLISLKQLLEVHLYEYRRTREHPAVKDTIRRIENTETEIAEFSGEELYDVEEVPNLEKIRAQKEIRERAAEFQATEKQVEELDAEIERYEVLNRNFFAVRNEYLGIERDLADARDQLQFWDENLRRTTVALTLEVSDRGMRLSPVQRAQDLARPSSPTLARIMGLAVFAGLAVGALFIVLAELLDHSYRSVEQAIDDIKLPVLGAVNEIVSPGIAMRRKVLGWGVFPTLTVVLCLVLMGVFMVTKLSLDAPHQYDELQKNPVKYIKQRLTQAF